MSLLSTAKSCGLNPHTYPLDILNRLPSMTDKHIEALLPQNWLNSRKAA